jgi:hypothetical protein
LLLLQYHTTMSGMITRTLGASISIIIGVAMLVAVFALSSLHAFAAEDADSNVSATVNAELREAIMSAVTSDPRADALTPDELNALVDDLTTSAQDSGVEPSAISIGAIKESQYSNQIQTAACGGAPPWLCRASESLGFIGPDPSWPLLLGVLALVLLLIGVLINIHHKRTGVHPLL